MSSREKKQASLLKEFYEKSEDHKLVSNDPNLVKYLDNIALNSYKQKGVYTVLITLLVQKTYDPKQDIRYHQSSMIGGFSGRSIDTKYITPTLRQLNLPCMAESGWLTRSLEQPSPYKLNYKGKIRNKKLKKAFLKIIDEVQCNGVDAKSCLKYLINKTKEEREKNLIKINRIPDVNRSDLLITDLIFILEQHFHYKYFVAGASKLPVIAVHSILKLLEGIGRYKNCKLKDLGSHTASDKTSQTIGDIEILKDNKIFEAFEIKHGIKISSHMISRIEEKIYSYPTPPLRYYVLSTASVEVTDREKIQLIISRIRIKSGCYLECDQLLRTIKYFCRLIISPERFLDIYCDHIENDREIKKEHKEIFNKIMDRFFKDRDTLE